MKNILCGTLVTCMLSVVFAAQSRAQDAQPAPTPQYERPLEKSRATSDDGTAMSRPNALSIELLGRGLLYSFDYDRSLTDSFAIGAGIAGYSVSGDGVTASILVIPIYGNFYFSPGPSRGFLTAGLDFASVSASGSGTTLGVSGAAPVIGGGYEYRGEGGFLFRFPIYVIVGNGNTQFWFGVGLGFTF